MNNDLPLIEPEDLDNIQPGYLGPTPPIGQPPPRGERIWVDRPEQLLHMASILIEAKVVAIDAEFAQVRSYTQKQTSPAIPRLSLLQLAIDHYCFVIDTLRLKDLVALKSVLERSDKIMLFHGAGADLRVMAERGLDVVHYYDLEATSRSLFGQHESSLAAMLQRAFAVHLDKSLQRTDWTRRPLPPAMLAYAARDAEVTLALYYWLAEHFPTTLKLHEYTGQHDAVAAWIEPFLQGISHLSPEMAVAEAQVKGVLRDQDQVIADCRAALAALRHPMLRNRLVRLITDLSLVQLMKDIFPLLQATTADERGAGARALGRLRVKSAHKYLLPLLHDPVYDVRKSAQTALRNLCAKEPDQQRALATKAADGTRHWVVEAADPSPNEEHGWKNRLRSMLDT